MVFVQIDQNVPDDLRRVRKIRQYRLNPALSRYQNHVAIRQQREIVMNANGGDVTARASGYCELLVQLDCVQLPNCLSREIDFAHHRFRVVCTRPKKAYEEVSIGQE